LIRRVAAHIWDLSKKTWRVHLRCGHVVVCSKNDHDRKVKARFCPSCPGAERALMADLRNENARRYQVLVEKERAARTPKESA
jgi:hypothetical protein